ncbi:MAG TPA: threonine synthase, partial [Chloroflexota bacterium]|nr:threonine synthase [Chloroflexota bacterium]
MTSTLASAPATAGAPSDGAAPSGRLLCLQCRECGREYAVAPVHVCDFCFGPLEVRYDYDLLARTVTRESIARGPLSIWRYADLLPLEDQSLADTGWRVGFTPLQPAPNLGRALG